MNARASSFQMPTVRHCQTTTPPTGPGARDPQPADPDAPGLDRVPLHLTMKNTAQLPTTLRGETNLFVEGLTDSIITLAANTLADVTEA